MQEVFKDIPNYEGKYQVSNLGRVKSISRLVSYKKCGKRKLKEIILKAGRSKSGYYTVALYNDRSKSYNVHQLVAMVFLNHIPNGSNLVVNHINLNKLDNRLENLEIVTMRENSNKKHLKSTSQYTGVSWHKKAKKWESSIYIKANKKQIKLGYFTSEYYAHLAYQKALKEIVN